MRKDPARRRAHAAALAALAMFLGAAVLVAPGAFASVKYVAPGHTAVVRVLERANEVTPGESAGCAKNCEHLHQSGKAAVVPDGHGGWITAIPAVRWPTADGMGQLVLFWHNTTFVGTDALTTLPNLGEEAVSVGIVRTGRNAIVLKYARYKPTDAMCCPSLKPVNIVFRWSGSRMESSAPVPDTARLKNMRFVLVP